MANPGYVRSTDGDDADDGSTWALANATLAGAMTDQVAGDTIYVSDAHAESAGAAKTITFPGTLASPNKVICGDDAASPPTAVSTAGTVTTTGNFGITLIGCAYVRGLSFSCGTTSVSPTLQLANNAADRQTFEDCNFILAASGTGARVRIGSSTTSAVGSVRWQNCGAKLANASQAIRVQYSRFDWEGGSWLSGGTSPTTVFEGASQGHCRIDVNGVDFSNLDASNNLFTANAGSLRATIRNCKLPSSWSGALCLAFQPGTRVEMYNCDAGDTNYRLWIADEFGDIKQETTIVRTGGANDGTTGLAWRMESSADAEYPHQTLVSPEIVQWNDTTGASKTVTVEIVTDNVTLTDGECWLEVMYLGTAGYPLGTWISDAKADVLATAANQTTSSETWTTTGLTTPVKQKLSVTFTPQEKGFIHARVVLAKASTTVYVCPKADVT